MRLLAPALALLVAATPALACVCSPPENDEQKREIATRIATSGAAIVDVEQIAPMDFDAMRGETYRVAKIHLGKAPERFELARDFHQSSGGQVSLGTTSCDEIPPAGRRTTVVLYATPSPGKFRFGGTCDQYFVNEIPDAIKLIRDARQQLSAERG